MNILIIGDCPQKLITLIRNSEKLDKIYTANSQIFDDIPNIEYKNFEDLVKKVRMLQIDISITVDRTLIYDGIADFFKSHRMPIIACNKKWFNLETSRLIAKQLVSHYSINIPAVLKYPVTFPVLLKTDFPDKTEIALSMKDLIQKKQELENELTYIEDYMQGEVYEFLSLWDGASLYNFKKHTDLTEVQIERLSVYQTKLNFMLSDEKADFSGFFVSKLLWTQNDWYLLEYKMHLDERNIPTNSELDFLYLLSLTVYQKLNYL